ncbi:uncharacterized protein V1477_000711 [Vespula maculifrons]|uniref:G-protein coupled receptors family 1 profile domain-containing protein n=1 Tax=Vespula maculifrons TaxID=7453 RepID=A0ABD2D2E2_VESMC
MSAIATESLASTVADESTTALVPTVTRIDTRLDVSPISVVLAVSIVCILSPITVTGNSIILAAFYRYKRLRTASNYLLVSLAVSDFGVGVFMPFGMQLELSGPPENGTSTLCILPYCIVIALCSVSVLVTVAIAVDRLTSLAQPLRYKNIITHSSIEKYIAVFWIYAICVGLSPLIYARITGLAETHSGGCRFGAAVLPPVRVFLVVAVWAPSALVLLGCYVYVYLVARAHARAIYTVELSFRHQTQTMALPRYGQTLAVTVGAFFILWLPFQTCMLLDIFYDTNFLSEWAVVWLGLPILSHSGANPWIYAFHHGEMRIAAGKIAEDLVALFGVTPSRYGGCSPARRASNTNLELAEVNNGNDLRRQRVENCFAAKRRSSNTLCSSKRCLDASGRQADISPERNEADRSSSSKYYPNEIVGEDIEDLRKMLDPKYIIDRNHVIDSNHNIDKIKNLKYLLDPTFGKIRHLRRLNRKRLLSKNFSKKWSEPKFISYQNLNSDYGSNRKFLRFNAMSDSALNANSPVVECRSRDVEATAKDADTDERGNSNLSSMSYPNIRTASGNASDVNSRAFAANENDGSELVHRYSVQNLSDDGFDVRPSTVPQFSDRRRAENRTTRNVYSRARARARFDLAGNTDVRIHSYSSLSTAENSAKRGLLDDPRGRLSTKSTNLVGKKLPNLACFGPKQRRAAPEDPSKKDKLETEPSPRRSSRANRTTIQRMTHSESVSRIEPSHAFFRSSKLAEGLTIPIIHSEPPSPLEPAPLSTSREEHLEGFNVGLATWNKGELESSRDRKSPVRHSDPTLPSVSFHVEDFSEPLEPTDHLSGKETPPDATEIRPETTAREPKRSLEAILGKRLGRSRDDKSAEPIFGEHDSTRFDSRRPSDSKWSESSKSQEILSRVNERQAVPSSSYSVNDFQTCNSGSDLNDPTSLDPFMCPEPLTSSLRESFFDAPSAPDSDVFTSFEENDTADFSSGTDPIRNDSSPVYNSVSAIDLKSLSIACEQSKSTESVFRGKRAEDGSRAILRLESSPSVHRAKIRVRSYKDARKTIRLAPLAVPTPTDLSTPTFELVSETKTDEAVLV